MRSTDVHSWPALAKAPAAAWAAAHSGSTPSSVLAAELEQRLAQVAGARGGELAPRGHRAGVDDERHLRMGGQRAPGAGVAEQQVQDRAEVEQLDEPDGGQR